MNSYTENDVTIALEVFGELIPSNFHLLSQVKEKERFLSSVLSYMNNDSTNFPKGMIVKRSSDDVTSSFELEGHFLSIKDMVSEEFVNPPFTKKELTEAFKHQDLVRTMSITKKVQEMIKNEFPDLDVSGDES